MHGFMVYCTGKSPGIPCLLQGNPFCFMDSLFIAGKSLNPQDPTCSYKFGTGFSQYPHVSPPGSPVYYKV